MLAISGASLYSFRLPLKDFSQRAQILGNDLVSSPEIIGSIDTLNLDGKFFHQINSRQIKNNLKSRPLIKDVKVRAKLFPKPSYLISIQEEKPWAIYRGQIFNDSAKMIIGSRASGKMFSSQAVEDLYLSVENASSLLSISSYGILEQEQIETIKKISDEVEQNLALIDANEKLNGIVIDYEDNLTLSSQNLDFKLGALNEKTLERAQRLDHLVSKIKEIELSQDVAYVDLSLSTDEVIIGRRT